MNHVDSVHKNEVSHNIRICGKSASHNYDLKQHVEKVHEIRTTIQKDKSPSCNKSYSQKVESKLYKLNELKKFIHHPSV